MQSFITSLDYQDMLSVRGEDSEKFLQGQLTCDLGTVATNGSQLGALCNNKGRVYASFRLLNLAGEYILTMPQGIAGPAMLTLKKYIPFYKAELSISNARYRRFGLAGEEARQCLSTLFPALPSDQQALVHDGLVLLNISTQTPRFELWLDSAPDKAQQSILDPLISSLPEGGQADWEILDHEAGLFFLHPEETALFTPEELNLDLNGFISFDKGCYTGQEIVARMHYRGKAKKRLFRVQFFLPGEPPTQIQEKLLFDDQDSTLGIVCNILYLSNNTASGLVTLRAETATDTPAWLHAADTRLPATLTAL